MRTGRARAPSADRMHVACRLVVGPVCVLRTCRAGRADQDAETLRSLRHASFICCTCSSGTAKPRLADAGRRIGLY